MSDSRIEENSICFCMDFFGYEISIYYKWLYLFVSCKFISSLILHVPHFLYNLVIEFDIVTVKVNHVEQVDERDRK